MRVALLSPLAESVPPRLYGGTERVVANLCRGLTENDVEVTVFAPGDSSVEGRLIPTIDESLRFRRRAVDDVNPYQIRMLAQVHRFAGDFDVIHNHNDYWMLPLSEMTDTPVVTTLHGRLDLPDIAAAFLSYPRMNYVSISDSQRGPMQLLRWARTIHHGIATEDFVFHPRPGKYLAFLGRVSPEKGTHLAIEIAKHAGVPLKIAAKVASPEECPADYEYWERIIKPQVDGRQIEYLGEVSESEKAEFLGNALALVFPIDWPEPFGLVMIEALACGTPVLARPCGAAREILCDGITGWSHADVRELARRVEDVPHLDRRHCRDWVEKRFSLQRMTEDYIDVYRTLAAARTQEIRRQRSTDHRRNFLHPVQRTADGDR